MKIRGKIFRIIVVLLTSIAFRFSAAVAQTAPKLLPFQGRLTDQNGNAVSNGVRLVQFKIYDVPTSGSPVWAGELHRTTINGGLVNVMLGSKTPLTGVDFDKQLYLEITVDVNGPTGEPDNSINASDPPMLPRQVLLPAVFAKEAADSRKLGGYDWSTVPSGIAVPVGAVIMWWGNVADIPTNFELCDGSVPSTLGATLGGNKPDLRDRFAKGASVGTTSKQALISGGTNTLNLRHQHATEPHTHTVPHHHDADNLWVPMNSGESAAIWFGHDPEGQLASRGSIYPTAYGWVVGGRATTPTEKQGHTSGTAVYGTTADANPISSAASPNTDFQLSATTDNRPAFLELFYIIRVK